MDQSKPKAPAKQNNYLEPKCIIRKLHFLFHQLNSRQRKDEAKWGRNARRKFPTKNRPSKNITIEATKNKEKGR